MVSGPKSNTLTSHGKGTHFPSLPSNISGQENCLFNFFYSCCPGRAPSIFTVQLLRWIGKSDHSCAVTSLMVRVAPAGAELLPGRGRRRGVEGVLSLQVSEKPVQQLLPGHVAHGFIQLSFLGELHDLLKKVSNTVPLLCCLGRNFRELWREQCWLE